MRRIVAVLLICLLGCGGGSFQGTFRSGSPVFSLTGFVSFVELTTIPESTIVVTIVTFLPDFSPATTVIFCGDLTQQLFLDDFATVNFTQGSTCATALAIFVDCCGLNASAAAISASGTVSFVYYPIFGKMNQWWNDPNSSHGFIVPLFFTW